MSLSNTEVDAIYLTVALASTTTLLLLILGTPLAWWLSRRQGTVAALIEAIVARFFPAHEKDIFQLLGKPLPSPAQRQEDTIPGRDAAFRRWAIFTTTAARHAGCA